MISNLSNSVSPHNRNRNLNLNLPFLQSVLASSRLGVSLPRSVRLDNRSRKPPQHQIRVLHRIAVIPFPLIIVIVILISPSLRVSWRLSVLA
jgi:hypothetical protein